MATVLQDDFNDTDATPLASHTMDVGSGWTEHQGSWEIRSNKARMDAMAGDGQNVATADAGAADLTVDVSLTFGPFSVDDGIVANFADNNNYWIAIGSGTSWILYERSSGSFTSRGTSTGDAPSTSATKAMSVITSGDSIELKTSGASRITYSVGSRPHKTATRFGLRSYHASTLTDARFEDFLAATAAAASKAPPPLRRPMRVWTRPAW